MQDVITQQPAVSPRSTFQDADLQAFSEFVGFFCAEFSRPGFLDGVACRQSFREYVPKYFARTFGPGVRPMDHRHFKWFRRLRSLLTLPKGSTIVDYGGGYGMDSIFLASRGYKVILYEITLNHIAIAEQFAARWRQERGAIEFRSILRDRRGPEPFGDVDAILLDEVAHHIEPVQGLFAKAATILRPGGRLFLLEPNAWSPVSQAYFLRVRGLKTVIEMTDEETGERYLYGNEHIRVPSKWNRIAKRAGFDLERREHVVPFGMTSESRLHSPLRRMVEATRGLRSVVATHVTSVYRLRSGFARRRKSG